MRGRKMTVHAVGCKSLGVVHMGGCLPGIAGELNFMAGGTKPGRRGAHHGVIHHGKNPKIIPKMIRSWLFTIGLLFMIFLDWIC